MANIDLSIFQGGDDRIVLPVYFILPLYFLPSLIMTGIITIPVDQLSTGKKQILSIPLLVATFMIPFGFTFTNKMLEILSTFSHTLFLRFFELFWASPILLHRPAYATFNQLWIDSWSCLRTFPSSKDQTYYKKDKKFYHLFLPLALQILALDIVGSWLATFNLQDVLVMKTEQPVLFFVFYIAYTLFLSHMFNVAGYVLHITYCLVFEKGSYSSAQWRPLVYNPLLFTTLTEFWSVRWHGLFKSAWLAFPFRQTYELTKQRSFHRSTAFALASMAVFVASGTMHEYIVACNAGWSVYRRVCMGQETIFFAAQGVGVFVEQVVGAVMGRNKSTTTLLYRRLIQKIWTTGFFYMTFYYFVHGFMQWGLHLGNPFLMTQPYMIQIAKAYPPLLSYLGSLV